MRNIIGNLIDEKSYLKSGGVKLLTFIDTIDILLIAKELNVSLLGIDGFYIVEERLQPSMEDSIDISITPYGTLEDEYNAAFQFLDNVISKNSDTLYYELVF